MAPTNPIISASSICPMTLLTPNYPILQLALHLVVVEVVVVVVILILAKFKMMIVINTVPKVVHKILVVILVFEVVALLLNFVVAIVEAGTTVVDAEDFTFNSLDSCLKSSCAPKRHTECTLRLAKPLFIQRECRSKVHVMLMRSRMLLQSSLLNSV